MAELIIVSALNGTLYGLLLFLMASGLGAEVEQVQKMDKRQFSYVAGSLDSGFYVNFIFSAGPELIEKLRAKFKLDPEVYRQSYQRLHEKTEKPGKKLAKAK